MNILSKINNLAKTNPQKLVDLAEKNYDNELNELVGKIIGKKEYKIILLAGPSGSGKTTTAHILKEKLIASGKNAQVVSLDHFFLPMDKMPLQENGEKDFESVYSLDIKEIHRCFNELIETGKTLIPDFSFNTFTKTGEYLLDISDGGILIVEGLHALNNILTDELNHNSLFKIYISVNKTVFDDNGNKLLSSRQLRLIRRMSRDFLYRNTDAIGTLKLWTSVVRGEEKYLYCFKDTADVKLFTFHSYEPCLFKNIILDLLKDLPKTADNYDYIMDAKKALEKFESINAELVPQNSLISEFIPKK
jgi:uridine kinase